MVIKGTYKQQKRLQNTPAFMLLEVVILLGMIMVVSSIAAMTHSLIMQRYARTLHTMAAITHAENILVNTVSHVPLPEVPSLYSVKLTREPVSVYPALSQPLIAVRVYISWREQGEERAVDLVRVVPAEMLS